MVSPRRSLRTRLILSFSIVIVLGVFLSAIIGIALIRNTIVRQAAEKVRFDLNSAREIYSYEAESIQTVIRITADRFFLKDALLSDDRDRLERELQQIRIREGFDFLTLTDPGGRVLVRAGNPPAVGDTPEDGIVRSALEAGAAPVATRIMPGADLAREDPALAERARITPIPTPMARIQDTTTQTAGMVIEAAAPVQGYGGELLGALYGGNLLNRSYAIVDEVKDVLYRGSKHRGVDIGTVTIFQGDIRIATNVLDADGERAIGTRVSAQVYDRVLEEGLPWIDRAFVVNSWYLTAYEPIRDADDRIIGMLYVGMLEAPYVELQNRVVLIMVAVALVSMVLLWVIGRGATRRIVHPIGELVAATNRVAGGDLTSRVDIRSEDELGLLARSFNLMAEEQQRCTARFQELTNSLEKRIRQKTEQLEAAQENLIRSEKLGSLGKMAAGIAHEINNPLTSILINSQLLQEQLGSDERYRENFELIIDETRRCSTIVRGLLDFARQSEPEKTRTDLNRLIERTLLLVESQALIHQVTITTRLDESLPEVSVDPNKLGQVFTNIILNALDAVSGTGELEITSGPAAGGSGVEIVFRDTGCGIPEDILGKVFDPFFSTKGMEGTGLGLAVSYGIIEQHDGTIDIESQVGVGTTVRIRLPVPAGAE